MADVIENRDNIRKCSIENRDDIRKCSIENRDNIRKCYIAAACACCAEPGNCFADEFNEKRAFDQNTDVSDFTSMKQAKAMFRTMTGNLISKTSAHMIQWFLYWVFLGLFFVSALTQGVVRLSHMLRRAFDISCVTTMSGQREPLSLVNATSPDIFKDCYNHLKSEGRMSRVLKALEGKRDDAGQQTTQKPDLDLTYFFAHMCSLVYEDNKVVESVFETYLKNEKIFGKDLHWRRFGKEGCVIMVVWSVHHNFITMVFKGTSPLDLTEWMVDASLDKAFPLNGVVTGGVHQGFYNSLGMPTRAFVPYKDQKGELKKNTKYNELNIEYTCLAMKEVQLDDLCDSDYDEDDCEDPNCDVCYERKLRENSTVYNKRVQRKQETPLEVIWNYGLNGLQKIKQGTKRDDDDITFKEDIWMQANDFIGQLVGHEPVKEITQKTFLNPNGIKRWQLHEEDKYIGFDHRHIRKGVASKPKLWITGHSLGAATATIFSAIVLYTSRDNQGKHLKIPSLDWEWEFDLMGTYTYGTPRTGGLSYRVAIESLSKYVDRDENSKFHLPPYPVHRIVNNNDIVCSGPIKIDFFKTGRKADSVFDYYHIGTPYRMQYGNNYRLHNRNFLNNMWKSWQRSAGIVLDTLLGALQIESIINNGPFLDLTSLMVLAPELMEVCMLGIPSLLHDHALSMYIENIECRLLAEEERLGKAAREQLSQAVSQDIKVTHQQTVKNEIPRKNEKPQASTKKGNSNTPVEHSKASPTVGGQ